MSDYKCWAPDEGETEADARIVRVSDSSGPREAAEIFAEQKFQRGDPFTAIEVSVRAGDRVHLFVVDVFVNPSFVATEMRSAAREVE